MRPSGSTFLDNGLTIHENVATGYKRGLEGYVRDRIEEMSDLTASGAVVTTTADLYRFQKTLHRAGDGFLSEASRELLFHAHETFGPTMDLSYLGLLTKHSFQDGGETITLVGLGTGSNYGFRSRITRLLEKTPVTSSSATSTKTRPWAQRCTASWNDC